MTGKFKGRHIGQVDTVMIDGSEYTRADLVKAIREAKGKCKDEGIKK